jgi:hypothetical protein
MLISIMRPFVFAMVRHILTTAGGFFAAKGIISGSAVTDFIGAGMVMAGVLWSWWEKVGHGSMLAMLQHRHETKTAKAAENMPPAFIALALAAFLGGMMLSGGEASAASQGRSERVKVTARYIPTQAKVKINPLLHPIKAAQAALGIDVPAYLDQLSKASLVDLAYAKALADGANTAGSQMRAKCWQAWMDVINQTTGAKAGVEGGALGPTPESAAFTRIEQVAQFADAMQPDPSCWPARLLARP